MAIEPRSDSIPANDGFEAFYAEKIWSLIPALYRDEDARAPTPGTLRAFVEVLASQAAVERRGVDRLWADAHIVDCDEWAIPYIAELLATRLVSAQNPTGRRADVARTIPNRRRAGTKQLLARLADDIAGWDAVASEAFKRLIRFWHGLDCPPVKGRVTGSPQHGLPRFGSARMGEIRDTAWDEFAHFPDFRRLRGQEGRYNIPKINLHVYRQFALGVTLTTPHRFDDRHYTLDPSGRDIPLFIPGRSFIEDCRDAQEWEVRRPLSCGLLNDGRYRPGADAAAASIGSDLLQVEEMVFPNAAALIARAAHIRGAALTEAQGRNLLNLSLLPDTPRFELLPNALSLAIGTDPQTDALTRAELWGGDLSAWDTLDPSPFAWVRAVVDPSRGRIWLDEAPPPGDALFAVLYHYGQFGLVGAGPYDRQDRLDQTVDAPLPDPTPPSTDPAPFANFDLPGAPVVSAPAGTGVYQINDSRTYLHRPVSGIVTTGDLTVQAANGERPYVHIDLPAGTSRFEIGAANDGDDLTLDGLWLGLFPNGHGPVPDPAPPVATELALTGNFDTVTLRNMTIDPGGIRARISPGQTDVIPAVTLLLESAIDRLVIENCILGPIDENTEDGDRCTAGEICILDSILIGGLGSAITTRHASLEIARSTVFGSIEALRFLIEDSIVQGTLSALDRQGSCVRYSAAVETPAIGIPNAYRTVAFSGAMPNHLFRSRRFGDPGLAQLSDTAPDSLRRGAESTSEMGAFHREIDAIKRDDLTRKLAEFSPVNVIPQLVFET